MRETMRAPGYEEVGDIPRESKTEEHGRITRLPTLPLFDRVLYYTT